MTHQMEQYFSWKIRDIDVMHTDMWYEKTLLWQLPDITTVNLLHYQHVMQYFAPVLTWSYTSWPDTVMQPSEVQSQEDGKVCVSL